MEPTFYTRRDFLRCLTLAGTAALLPLAAAEAAPPQYLPAGAVTAYKPGGFVGVTLSGGQRAYVRRLPGKTATFLALSPVCTHRGCTVGWEQDEQQFVCPCHGGRFNAQGVNVGGPPPRPLQVLPTKITNGTLYIQA